MRSEIARSVSKIIPLPTKRGLNRVEAAGYIGVGVSKFDEMVADGRMPTPKRIDVRKIWDARELDLAFEALPTENCMKNEWDSI